MSHEWVNVINAYECKKCKIRRNILSDESDLKIYDMVPYYVNFFYLKEKISDPFPTCSEVHSLKDELFKDKGHKWDFDSDNLGYITQATCSICDCKIHFAGNWYSSKGVPGIRELKCCDDIMMEKALR